MNTIAHLHALLHDYQNAPGDPKDPASNAYKLSCALRRSAPTLLSIVDAAGLLLKDVPSARPILEFSLSDLDEIEL